MVESAEKAVRGWIPTPLSSARHIVPERQNGEIHIGDALMSLE